MKKSKKLNLIGILGGFLLVVSIAYAGVLSYYGKIVGTVNVQPPIFYADFTNMTTGWKKLSINALPTQTGEVTITDSNSFAFHTESLGITSFYAANWNFFVKAKVSSPPKALYLELWTIDPSNGDLLSKICEKSVSITSNEYDIYSTTCTPGQFALSSSDGLAYVIRGAAAPTVNYTIDVDSVGSTRIEVSPA